MRRCREDALGPDAASAINRAYRRLPSGSSERPLSGKSNLRCARPLLAGQTRRRAKIGPDCRLDGHSPVNSSHFSLLGHLQRIVDFDAEVSHGALDLAVAKQELHGSQILSAPVDQGRFSAAH